MLFKLCIQFYLSDLKRLTKYLKLLHNNSLKLNWMSVGQVDSETKT